MCWSIYKPFQPHFHYKNIIDDKWEINLSIAARKKKNSKICSQGATFMLFKEYKSSCSEEEIKSSCKTIVDTGKPDLKLLSHAITNH